MSTQATEQVVATPAILRKQLADYRRARQKWTTLLASTNNTDEARDETFSPMMEAEREIARTVISLVGYEPREDWPVAVVIDGLPVTVYHSAESDTIRATIPGLDDVIAFTRAD